MYFVAYCGRLRNDYPNAASAMETEGGNGHASPRAYIRIAPKSLRPAERQDWKRAPQPHYTAAAPPAFSLLSESQGFRA